MKPDDVLIPGHTYYLDAGPNGLRVGKEKIPRCVNCNRPMRRSKRYRHIRATLPLKSGDRVLRKHAEIIARGNKIPVDEANVSFTFYRTGTGESDYGFWFASYKGERGLGNLFCSQYCASRTAMKMMSSIGEARLEATLKAANGE